VSAARMEYVLRGAAEMQILGGLLGIVLAALLLVNGTFMLISPPAWFKLPQWLASNGNLNPEKYSRGWGALQVRIAGVAFISVVVWVVSKILITR
jgi:hypothetical protein